MLFLVFSHSIYHHRNHTISDFNQNLQRVIQDLWILRALHILKVKDRYAHTIFEPVPLKANSVIYQKIDFSSWVSQSHGKLLYRNLYDVFSHHYLSWSPAIAWWKIVTTRSTNITWSTQVPAASEPLGGGIVSLEWCTDPTRCPGIHECLCSQGIWVRHVFHECALILASALAHVIRALKLSSPPMTSPGPTHSFTFNSPMPL